MRGLGDNIYVRAFIKTLIANGDDVFIRTPWPELFEDYQSVHFLKDDTALRTQAKNVRRQDAMRWVVEPAQCRRISPSYGVPCLRDGSIVDAMERSFLVPPSGWDLPAFPRMVRDKPIAVIRPVTERREWWNSARGPLPAYVAHVSASLMATHHVISVADIVPNVEWLIGEAPPAHERFHAGELDVRQLLGLIQSADVVVGGVGWIVPACASTGVPLFCILGGQGGHNAPDKVTHSSMDLRYVRFARPNRYCLCESMRHACNKTITNIAGQWAQFRRECLDVRHSAARADVDTEPWDRILPGATEYVPL